MLEAKVKEKDDGQYAVDLKIQSSAIDAISEIVELTRAVATVFQKQRLGREVILGVVGELEDMLREFDEPEVDDG